MNAAMYLFINRGLNMSPGKIAAQAGHAACEATLLSTNTDPAGMDLWRQWREGLHYQKLVMEARDADHLEACERYLIDRGFRTALIVDEGRTEVPPLSLTAMGVALVDKDDPHTKATFEAFKLYRDKRPPTNIGIPETQGGAPMQPETRRGWSWPTWFNRN